MYFLLFFFAIFIILDLLSSKKRFNIKLMENKPMLHFLNTVDISG